MKVLKILAICCIVSNNPLVAQTTLYSADFSGGFPSGWTSSPTGVGDPGSGLEKFSITNLAPSSGYAFASGGNNLLFKNCSPNEYHEIVTTTISTTGYGQLQVRFGHRKTNTFGPAVTLEWSSNGVRWTNITYANAPSGSWGAFTSTNLPAAANNQGFLRFRFYYNSVNSPFNSNYNDCSSSFIGNYRIDDFQLIANQVLPISLLSFTATPRDGNTDLLWATATETNNAYFSLERSADGVHFDEITQVPGAGNSAATNNYAYTDRSPINGVSYYRLRQVDFDGAYSFSPVRRVVFGEANGVRLQPVPATETLQVLLDKTTEEDINWSVFDQSGRLVLDGQAAEETQQFDVDVQNLPQGMYLLRLTSGQFMHAVRFVKQP
jgi:hypothetical protein